MRDNDGATRIFATEGGLEGNYFLIQMLCIIFSFEFNTCRQCYQISILEAAGGATRTAVL